MKVKCFPHNSSISGFLNLHYCLCIIFSFSFSTSILAKKTHALTVVAIKPTLPKGEEKLTRKKPDSLEKYVVKIHSRDLRYNNEGASLCDQYFL